MSELELFIEYVCVGTGWLKIKRDSLAESGLHFFDTMSWYSLAMKGRHWKQEDEMPYSLFEFVVEQQGRKRSLLSKAADTGCVLVTQLGLGWLLLFSCKQALLLHGAKVLFLVFGTLLQCVVSLCLSGYFFCLGAALGRLLLVYSFLRAGMVLSSFISPSSFFDVSLKM